eukprot:654921_1
MAADPETSEDEDLFGSGDDHVDSPGTFGFLANQTSDNLNDDEELLPDQFHDPNYMAPSDPLLANQLLTSSESKSAYRLQKRVNIADNAPIIFADTKNENEPIIDYNRLLSTVDIKVPKSIILYSSNDHKITLKTETDENHADDEEDSLLSESCWQNEFENKSQLMKQTVLQTENAQYKKLKYEYDVHYDDHNAKHALLAKAVRNDSYDIRIKDHQFKNICDELKHSNPSLFMDSHTNGMDDKSQLRTQNLVQWMGYNEHNETELLAMDPQHIKREHHTEVDLSHLLERNQCDFDKEIIIDDAFHEQSVPPIIEEHDDDNDHDITMEDVQSKDSKRTNTNVIEMNVFDYKPDTETFLRSKYESKQKMDRLEDDNQQKKSKKRKHSDDDDDWLILHPAKRRKKQKMMQFKMRNSNMRQYEDIVTKNKNKKRKHSKEEEEDDLEFVVPSDDEDKMNDNETEYDEDVIGDDLFDMMPESDEDWNANHNDEPFGVVKDDTTQEEEEDKKPEIANPSNEEEQKSKAKAPPQQEQQQLSLLKCAVNNSSIWPNQNAEYESCSWLDSVIVSDDAQLKPMNVNLIIDLNDSRMRWTEEFVKNMTKYCVEGEEGKKKNADSDEEEDELDALKRKYATKKWNLSNDDQYTFADISQAQKRNLHTSMAYNLHEAIFPQVLSVDAWVALHREAIELRSSIKIRLPVAGEEGMRMDDICNKYSMYIPKNWRELSATYDRIVLLEYLEEYPLMIGATGMSSNMTTLFRNGGAKVEDIKVEDGTVRFLSGKEKSPLLGAPRSNKWVSVVENKLYVAPIRSHGLSRNVFLLVGSGHTFYIRRVNAVFAVGQIQPRQVVYHPGSRAVRSYLHDRTKVQIYRMFQQKDRVSVADVLRHYTLDSEDAIKECLRTVAVHDKSIGGGYWIRKSDFLSNRISEFEIQQMVRPEQEVLRQMFMNSFCRLYSAGIAGQLVASNRGGSWKRVLKNLVFNRDLLEIVGEMKCEMLAQQQEWDVVENRDTCPSLRLRALKLIEELMFCTSWYLSDQFLRCYRGEGEMRLNGYGNPFKDSEGFDYLRDRDKTSSEAIKLMVASAGSRANTKADFRRMPQPKAIQILKQRYLVPDAVLGKLDRRKIIELLQKKSREALSAGSQNKIALRYARLTGSRKTFARNQYLKKIGRLMKQHLVMLRGDRVQDHVVLEEDQDVLDLEQLMNIQMNEKNEVKKKLKLIKKEKLRYTFCYNDPITGERKKEIEHYTREQHPQIFKKYKLCVQEKDDKFLRLREYSKLYQMKMEEMEEDGSSGGTIMNDKQRERHEKMQRAKNMPREEREAHLSKLEAAKPYITCSSCKRKGHNSNNKFCPKYAQKLAQQSAENKEKNENDDDDAKGGGIDSFIERAIDKKHQSYRGSSGKKEEKAARKKKKKLVMKIDDPRLTFVTVLRHMMQRARDVNGSVTFKDDPTVLPSYGMRIQHPMCLDWIHDNILYTEQCIKAPYMKDMQQNDAAEIISAQRGEGKPDKKEYKKFESFKDDIALIHSNSTKYNGANSNFTALAWSIVEEVNNCERQYKATITSLNAEVNATYMQFDLQPILNELINGILDAPTLDAFKSTNTTNLYQIRQKVHDKHYQKFKHFVDDLKQLQQFCYDANKDDVFQTGLRILPTQFAAKLRPFKQQLIKIDPDSVNHFVLKKKPPFF